MNKVAQYLQEHLDGEVTDQLSLRRYFSTDASILTLTPSVIAFPRHENDIRKVARFSWQLAERGQSLPLTVRGGGTDTSGAAIGSGAILVTTKHLNKIIDLDPKQHQVIVQPGLKYGALQQTLETHGFSLPVAPNSAAKATIGGGVANNALGNQSVKYGSTQDYVKSLRVVLANGEAIETGPLGKRELSQKLGLANFEGQLYRTLDTLLEENAKLISEARAKVKARHSAFAYNLFGVKQAGQFDITPLFVGAQGSLGIITEASLHLETHNPQVSLAMVSLESLEDLRLVLPKIHELNPSSIELVNRETFQMVNQINPAFIRDFRKLSGWAIHLFVEFDNFKASDQERLVKNLKKITEKVGGDFKVASNEESYLEIDKLRQAVNILLHEAQGQKHAVPMLDGISVPPDQVVDFIQHASQIHHSVDLLPAIWGPVGSGVIMISPSLNIGEVGDRQKLFKLADGLFEKAVELGGSASAAGDGRVRASYTNSTLGKEMAALMGQVKQLFDPHNILNPGVKSLTLDEMKTLIRDEYSLNLV